MSDNTEPDPEGTRLAELLGSALGGPVIDAEATGEVGPGDDPSRDLTTGPDGSRGHSAASWRVRAEAAEWKLARIRNLCQRSADRIRADYPDAGPPAIPVSMGSILAIIGSEEGGDGYDRDFAGPVL